MSLSSVWTLGPNISLVTDLTLCFLLVFSLTVYSSRNQIINTPTCFFLGTTGAQVRSSSVTSSYPPAYRFLIDEQLVVVLPV
jgi:hypothetical protein